MNEQKLFYADGKTNLSGRSKVVEAVLSELQVHYAGDIRICQPGLLTTSLDRKFASVAVNSEKWDNIVHKFGETARREQPVNYTMHLLDSSKAVNEQTPPGKFHTFVFLEKIPAPVSTEVLIVLDTKQKEGAPTSMLPLLLLTIFKPFQLSNLFEPL